MQHRPSFAQDSQHMTLKRAALAALAYMLGTLLGLASSGLALLNAAQRFGPPDAGASAMLHLDGSSTGWSLLVASLAGGVVLAAICAARCLDIARTARATVVENRAAAVSVRSGDFLEGMTGRFTNAVTGQQSCSVVLISVDDFDALLQKHGRSTADAVLDAVAHALHGGVRASDVVGRVGYDGFAVVLAVEDGEVAMRASRRLHDAIQKVVIPLTNNGTLQLRASLGVAVRGSSEAMEAAFERAHDALQQALQDDEEKVRLAEPASVRDTAVQH